MIYQYKDLVKTKSNSEIKRLIDEKHLFKIDNGFYSTKENYDMLEYLTKRYKKAIVSGKTSLFYHGIIKNNSEIYTFAISHNSRPINDKNINLEYVSNNFFDVGIEEKEGNGYTYKIYDINRTLINVIKNKKKYSEEEYKEIIEWFKKNINRIDINKVFTYVSKIDPRLRKEIETELIYKNKYKEVKMKGIVLAGGSGTRLYPITEGVSKQLLPIYDKPMIFYPISTLMLAGIRDILIITTEEDQPAFKRLLKDGSQFGVNFSYIVQPSPDGLAQAFILGEEFIGNETCAMVLGDNLFYGNGFVEMLKNAVVNADKGYATNFGIEVPDPHRFGIMEIEKNADGVKVLSVEEKPANPKSNFAITGLYFYPRGVASKAKEVVPSARGELEITSLNDIYLKEEKLFAELLGGGFNWYDTGTFESLYEAISSIKNYQNNRGRIIACLEQIGYDNGWINDEQLSERAELLKKNSYGEYLTKVLKKERY